MPRLEIDYERILGKEEPIITSLSIPGFKEGKQDYHLYKDEKDVVALIGKKQAAFLFMADAPSLFNSDWCLKIFKDSERVRDCSLETYRGTIGFLESVEGIPLELKGFTGNGFTQTLDDQKRLINTPKGMSKQIIHASRKEISTPQGLVKLICFDSEGDAITANGTQLQIQTILERAHSDYLFKSKTPDCYRSIAEYVFCREYSTVIACSRLFQRKEMQGVFRYVAV